MSDEIFRIVVAAGVVLAGIAFVAQAGILFAIYRVSRKTEGKTAAFMARLDPVIAKVGPTLEKAGPIIDQIGPVIKKIGPVIDRIGPVVEKAGIALDRVPP